MCDEIIDKEAKSNNKETKTIPTNDTSAMDNKKWIRQFYKSKNIKSEAFCDYSHLEDVNMWRCEYSPRCEYSRKACLKDVNTHEKLRF